MIKSSKLRIASYNILHGGETRLDYVSKVITKINPDICGVLEAVGWQNKITLRKFANDLGYNFSNIAKANSRYNIAIISKLPLKIRVIKSGLRHVILEASVEKSAFKNLKIFFVHLSPVSENARLLEVNKLIKHLKKTSEAIVMGDFNSLSEKDPYDKKNILSILQKNKITKFGNKKLRFDVIEKIKSFELIDAMNYLKINWVSSTPTLSNKDPNHIINIRIDYAFLTKNLTKYLTNAKIYKSKLAEKASDHYPIFVDLHK